MISETIYGLRLGDVWQYVGRSVNVTSRAVAHRSRGLVFDSVVTLAVVPQEHSETVEENAIRALAPVHNRTLHGAGVHGKGSASPQLSVRMDKAEIDQLSELASENGHTLLSYVRHLLARHLSNFKSAGGLGA